MGGNMSLLKRMCVDDVEPGPIPKVKAPLAKRRPPATHQTQSPPPSVGVGVGVAPRPAASTDARDSYLQLAFGRRAREADPTRLDLTLSPPHLGHCTQPRRRGVETTFVRPARVPCTPSTVGTPFVRQKTSHHKILKELLNSTSASCVAAKSASSTRSKVQSRLVRTQMPRITIGPAPAPPAEGDLHAKAPALLSQFDSQHYIGAKSARRPTRGCETLPLAHVVDDDPLATKPLDLDSKTDSPETPDIVQPSETQPLRSASDLDDPAAEETQFTRAIRAAHSRLVQSNAAATRSSCETSAGEAPRCKTPARGTRLPRARTSTDQVPGEQARPPGDGESGPAIAGSRLPRTEADAAGTSVCPVCGQQSGRSRDEGQASVQGWACSLCGQRRPVSPGDKASTEHRTKEPDTKATKYPSFVPFPRPNGEGRDPSDARRVKVKTKVNGQRKSHGSDPEDAPREPDAEGSASAGSEADRPSAGTSSTQRHGTSSEERDRQASPREGATGDRSSAGQETAAAQRHGTSSEERDRQASAREGATGSGQETAAAQRQGTSTESAERTCALSAAAAVVRDALQAQLEPTPGRRQPEDGLARESKPYREARAVFERAVFLGGDKARRCADKTTVRHYLRRPIVAETPSCPLKPASHFERRLQGAAVSSAARVDGRTLWRENIRARRTRVTSESS